VGSWKAQHHGRGYDSQEQRCLSPNLKLFFTLCRNSHHLQALHETQFTLQPVSRVKWTPTWAQIPAEMGSQRAALSQKRKVVLAFQGPEP
jgi:hypothetical protein